jgi:hypothetical protein
MIDPYTLGPRELGFSWVDSNGWYHCWMTERMKRFAEKSGKEVVTAPMDFEYAQWCLKHNGIEKHRLERITPQVIAQIPVIYVELGDGTHKLVDGNHRYVKAATLGWRELPAYLFTVEQSNEFKLDIPAHMQDIAKATIPKFSGIY